MAGTIVVDRIESDSSYTSTINVASKVNFTGGMQIGGADASFGGMRNRIINGDMRIDQRNAGAAVTTSGSFPVDRFYVNNSSDATFSAQQSTDVPTGQGFVNSLKVTYSTGDASIGAAQYSNIQHNIEGFNVADLGFGGSGASSVTLSFWVKASVAGQYSYAIYNSAENRINPQAFTINATNTWEKKTITYVGDTTGTWLTNNGKGLTITLYTSLGSNYLGSAGWNNGGTFGVTGQANAMASNGNIFAITGVQLEKGSAASAFEHRQYAQELALCQRYYTSITGGYIGAHAFSSNRVLSGIFFPVTMRATPTASTATNSVYYFTNGSAQISTAVGLSPALYGIVQIDCTVTAGAGSSGVISLAIPITLNAEL